MITASSLATALRTEAASWKSRANFVSAECVTSSLAGVRENAVTE